MQVKVKTLVLRLFGESINYPECKYTKRTILERQVSSTTETDNIMLWHKSEL